MSTAFELPEEMTIYGAVETRDALLAWVAAQGSQSDQSLEISAAKVRACTATTASTPAARMAASQSSGMQSRCKGGMASLIQGNSSARYRQ